MMVRTTDLFRPKGKPMNDNPSIGRDVGPENPDDFFRQLDIQLLVHGMKGPLGIIESNTRMLLDAEQSLGRLSPPQRRALERSLRSSAKLCHLIHGLLEVGSCQAGQACLREFAVVPATVRILMDVLETEVAGTQIEPAPESASTQKDQFTILAAHGIGVAVSPDLEQTVIRQDERRFEHILTNLIRNALYYRKSRVTVEMMLVEEALHLRVCDDGPGVAPESRGDLFKRYVQLKPECRHERRKGHGFGLAASRILARSLGGDIRYDERYTDGAAFVLHLPMVFAGKPDVS
jgi:signal transduction histidine kinase